MHPISVVAASALLILSTGGALAEGTKAETAGGSGQSQAAPSQDATAPAVTVPTKAETAGGSGQSQAAPSEEATAPTAAQCPEGQVRVADGSCAPGQPDTGMPATPR